MKIAYLTYTSQAKNVHPTGGELYNEMVFGVLQNKRGLRWKEYCLDEIPAIFRSKWLSQIYYAFLFLFASMDLVIVDAGFLGRCAFSLWLLRLRGKTIVLVLHHLNFHLKANRVSRLYDVYCCKSGFLASHRMVCASEFSLEEIRGSFGYSKPILLIHPFISFSTADLMRTPRVKSQNTIQCLCVGSLEPRKNLALLVDLANNAPAHLDFKITIVGKPDINPSYAEKLRQAVTRPDRITFLGYCPSKELREIYAKAELFLFPSQWEGFGIAVLEALAFGIPVLAFRCSSMPFLIVSEVNGRLIEPYNAEAFIAEACSLIADTEKRNSLQMNCALPAKYGEGWDAKAERARHFLFPAGEPEYG